MLPNLSLLYLQWNFRCVVKEKCTTNRLTPKNDASYIGAEAEIAKCPPQKGNDPRNGDKPGQCCHEQNIIRDCSSSEFKSEGFKCVEKGQCFDKLEGKEKSGIKISDTVFYKAIWAKCPSESQVCCRKNKAPTTAVAQNENCEDNEGTVWHFYLQIFYLNTCNVYFSDIIRKKRRKLVKPNWVFLVWRHFL